jgi:hydroxymethylpyrimidine pyrophosphatase-like HAD family hydrolase
MLEVAGFAVAMGNSPKKVKAVADFITKTNNRNGVYHAIQEHFLNDQK